MGDGAELCRPCLRLIRGRYLEGVYWNGFSQINNTLKYTELFTLYLCAIVVFKPMRLCCIPGQDAGDDLCHIGLSTPRGDRQCLFQRKSVKKGLVVLAGLVFQLDAMCRIMPAHHGGFGVR